VLRVGLRAEHIAPGEVLGRSLPGGRLQDVTHLELAHVLRHDEGVGGPVRARGPVPISHHHAQVLGPGLKGDRHVVAGHVGRRGALLLQRIGVGRQREVEVVRGSEGLGHLCLLDHVLSIGSRSGLCQGWKSRVRSRGYTVIVSTYSADIRDGASSSANQSWANPSASS